MKYIVFVSVCGLVFCLIINEIWWKFCLHINEEWAKEYNQLIDSLEKKEK